MLSLGPVLAAALAAGPRIAVMPIAAGDAVSEKAAAVLTETLAAELRTQSGVEVVTARDLASLLSLEKQKQALGCTSDSCLADIAGAAGAERVVSGDLARLGESLLLQLRVLDAHRVRVVAQSQRRFRSGTLDDVLDALPAVVAELLRPGSASAAPPPSSPASAAPSPAVATVPRAGEVVLHYRRRDARYESAGLVTWASRETGADLRSPRPSIVPSATPDGRTATLDHVPPSRCGVPRIAPSGQDGWGTYWILPASRYPNGRVNFLVAEGGEWEQCRVDVGRFWILQDAREVWYLGAPDCTVFTDAEAARRAAAGG